MTEFIFAVLLYGLLGFVLSLIGITAFGTPIEFILILILVLLIDLKSKLNR